MKTLETTIQEFKEAEKAAQTEYNSSTVSQLRQADLNLYTASLRTKYESWDEVDIDFFDKEIRINIRMFMDEKISDLHHDDLDNMISDTCDIVAEATKLIEEYIEALEDDDNYRVNHNHLPLINKNEQTLARFEQVALEEFIASRAETVEWAKNFYNK